MSRGTYSDSSGSLQLFDFADFHGDFVFSSYKGMLVFFLRIWDGSDEGNVDSCLNIFDIFKEEREKEQVRWTGVFHSFQHLDLRTSSHAYFYRSWGFSKGNPTFSDRQMLSRSCPCSCTKLSLAAFPKCKLGGWVSLLGVIAIAVFS